MIFCEDKNAPDSVRASPLYPALSEYCTSNDWSSVNGVAYARRFSSLIEEYDAIWSGLAVLDLSMLSRVSFKGPDAAACIARLSSAPCKELHQFESGRGLILNAAGHVCDLCEVTRLGDTLFILTMSRSNYRRIAAATEGLDVAVEDLSGSVGALGLFGPNARSAAKDLGFELEPDETAMSGQIRGVDSLSKPTAIGRVIGVELIFPQQEALTIWERISSLFTPTPVGLHAAQALRLEGGTPCPGADFTSADDAASSLGLTPSEIGLPHLAPVNRAWFTGRTGLQEREVKRQLVSVMSDIASLEPGARVFLRDGDKQNRGGPQIGILRSSAYSPYFRGTVGMVDVEIEALGKQFDRKDERVKSGTTFSIQLPKAGQVADASLIETHEQRLASSYRERLFAATE